MLFHDQKDFIPNIELRVPLISLFLAHLQRPGQVECILTSEYIKT